MKCQLLHNLGTVEARDLNEKRFASLDLRKPATFAAGCTIELTDEGFAYLSGKHPALLSEVVKGVDKAPEVKGVKS